MRRETQKLLRDILEAAIAIQQFVSGRQLGDLQSDSMLRSAVYWQFVVIGEAVSQIRKYDETVYDQISEAWRIVGFRNQVVHAYSVLNDAVTWQIIQVKLPVLKSEVEKLLLA